MAKSTRERGGWAQLPRSLLDLCFEALNMRELLLTGESVCRAWQIASQSGESGWRRCGSSFRLGEGWPSSTSHVQILCWLAPRLCARLAARPRWARGPLVVDLCEGLYLPPAVHRRFLTARDEQASEARRALSALLARPWAAGLRLDAAIFGEWAVRATAPATLGGTVRVRARAPPTLWREWLGALGPVQRLVLSGSRFSAHEFACWASPNFDGTGAAAEEAAAAVAAVPTIAAGDDVSGRPLTVRDTLEALVLRDWIAGDMRGPLAALAKLRELQLQFDGDARLPALSRLSSLSLKYLSTSDETHFVIDGGDVPYPALRKLSLLTRATPSVLLQAPQLRLLTHITLDTNGVVTLPAMPHLESLSLTMAIDNLRLDPAAAAAAAAESVGGAPFPALHTLTLSLWVSDLLVETRDSVAPLCLLGSPALRHVGLKTCGQMLVRLVPCLQSPRPRLESVALRGALSVLTLARAVPTAAHDVTPSVARDAPTHLLKLRLYWVMGGLGDSELAHIVGSFGGVHTLLVQTPDSQPATLTFKRLAERAPDLRVLALSDRITVARPSSAACPTPRFLTAAQWSDLDVPPLAEWAAVLSEIA